MANERPYIDIVELDYVADPAHHFERLRSRPGAVLLDSGQPFDTRGRFDIASSDPLYSLIADDDGVRCEPYLSLPRTETIFAAQQALLDHCVAHDLPNLPDRLTDLAGTLPFLGGLLGYWSYTSSLSHRPPNVATDSRPAPGLPKVRLGLYDWALIQDHDRRRTFLVATPERREQVMAWLERPAPEAWPPFTLLSPFVSDLDRAGYGSRFRRVIDYIHAGDCYQINLAQRFTARFRGDPWHAYRRLREATPTPFGGYLGWGDQAILSLSPERFIRVVDGQVDTRPIKGTRPRGRTTDEDERLSESLRRSPKDRAENVMIVDLLRNDLGRVCRTGSVRVSQLCGLESYANVHHLVSVIEAELASGMTSTDLLAAAFPGGSITGAPKRRAMQIIDELEPSQRSVYCGSLGYLDRRGRLDTSIAIRTVIADGETLHIWGGGGLVADSNEDEEYRETLAKIERLMQALDSVDKDENDSR